MTEYRRAKLEGATFFFTVNRAERHGNHLLVTISIYPGRSSARSRAGIHLKSMMAVLPEPLHCIWILPPGDADCANEGSRSCLFPWSALTVTHV
jgi:putative transposase